LVTEGAPEQTSAPRHRSARLDSLLLSPPRVSGVRRPEGATFQLTEDVVRHTCLRQSGEVESVEVHDLVPRGDKVLHELLLGVRAALKPPVLESCLRQGCPRSAAFSPARRTPMTQQLDPKLPPSSPSPWWAAPLRRAVGSGPRRVGGLLMRDFATLATTPSTSAQAEGCPRPRRKSALTQAGGGW